MVGAQTDIDILDVVKAAGKQPGADQQHQRQSHLRNHQSLAESKLAESANHARGLILQGGRQLRPRALNGRDQPEQDAGEH